MPQEKNTQDRTAVIFELARHAHPSWYHSILNWPTPALRALLAYYKESNNQPALTPVFCVVGGIIKR